MKTPLIIINFKTYKQATGKNAVKLAKICKQVATQTKTNIAVAVQPTDIYPIKQAVSIPVLSQHIDPISFGSNTGYILPDAIKQAGAIGTLISHSEHHLSMNLIKKTIDSARTAKLACVVCARTSREAKQISILKPDFIAIEPPELIGGDISVSTSKPQLIANTVKKVPNIPVLTGAGVKNKNDVAKSIELGAQGILVASGVVKANNPKKALLDLVRGL
jgi:triosephosphate isomerase